MSRFNAKPQFPIAPREYSQQYTSEVVRQFSLYVQQVSNPGDAEFTTLRLTELPTHDSGFEEGTIYSHETFLRVSVPFIAAIKGSELNMQGNSVSLDITRPDVVGANISIETNDVTLDITRPDVVGANISIETNDVTLDITRPDVVGANLSIETNDVTVVI